MKSPIFRLLGAIALLGLALTACLPIGPTATEAPGGEQPYRVSGTFTVTNDFVLATYFVEHAVALTDMHGFVIRDEEWELPVASQVLGFMDWDPESKSGSYFLNLPALPQGESSDVDNDGEEDTGVQIYAVAYSPNLYGGVFSEGDDRSRGWPAYLASVRTDPERNDEVVGGRLIVWAPDGGQQFPTGFGEDGLLFTEDDPVAPLPAGYSIVDLEQEPFAVLREPNPELVLYEPPDIAAKDYSDLSYSEAFEKLFEIVRKEYAFNGIEGKEPDWDALYAELKPRVEEAEQKGDANLFYLALRDFTRAFKDGHVGLDGGEYAQRDFQAATEGGYGFAMRELDDGRVIVIFMLEDGPAAQAGMQVGAEVTEFNGKPIGEAISAVQPYAIQSSDFAIRYQQARYLLAAPVGTEATVTFVNPEGEPQTVTLTAIAERQSFSRTSIYFGADTDPLLPVEYRIITQDNAQVGYVKINSNFDDLGLIIRLFERALKDFTAREVDGLIIDMRFNAGGAPLGLAGFLYDGEIPMGQLEYYSDATGEFEPEGPRDKVLPNENQYRFDKMVLLVGPACVSACEVEAYGFSQVPGMIVVGQSPTAGMLAEVARGQFALPEGFSLQIPTGRFTLPDGSLFIEEQGIPPTLRVPVDETTVFSTVFSTEDVVLPYGIRAVLQPLGAGITPSGSPKIATPGAARSALTSAPVLQDLARERYTEESYEPTTLTFTIALSESKTLIWPYGWCAKSQEILEQNFEAIELKFVLNGEEVPEEQFAVLEGPSDDLFCRYIYTALSDWPAGEHHLSITATFTETINDGIADYAPGDYVYDFTVYVKP